MESNDFWDNEVESALSGVWDALWNRADMAYYMVQKLNKEQIGAVMDRFARSHQSVYKWAAMSEYWPTHTRAKDKSYQTHQRMMKKGVNPETLELAPGTQQGVSSSTVLESAV